MASYRGTATERECLDKSVGGGVQEARVMFGAGYRVYFGQDGASLVLLLVGGTKGSQTTDIRRAQEYWRDYLKEN